MELFKLLGTIAIENGNANEAIDETNGKANEAHKTLQDGIETAAKWGAAIAAGAVAAGTAVVAFATKAASTADNIDKMSQKIGISREAYQELDFICSQSGTSVDTLQQGVKTLTNQMQSAADGTATATEAFDKLGVSIYDSNGNLKDQETMMWEAMKALQGMENQTEKAALATDLFGRSGTELMPLLNGATGSIDAMKEQAHELGLVLDDELIDSGVKLTDTMDQTKRALSAVGTNITAELMPIVQSGAEFIQAHLPEIKEAISNVESAVIGVIDKAIQISTWMNEHQTTMTVIAILIGTVTTAILAYNVAMNAATIATTIATAATTAATAATTAFGAVMAFITSPISLVILAIGSLIAIGVALYKNWDSVTAAASALWSGIKSTFEKIKTTISNVMTTASNVVKSAIDKIKGFFKFEWSLPKLKMPHFSIQGSFSLNPPSIPTFGVDWYAKAMDDPMIMTQPTAFGINSNGQVMAGGEKGSEVVSGTDTLMNMISAAVATNNTEMVSKIQRLIDLVASFFPQVLSNMGYSIVLDDGTLVGRIAPAMDAELGRIASRNERL